jgi:hypothetical protein
MLRAIRKFIGGLRPLSEHEKRDRFLAQAKDLVHLEVLMKQWERGARY